MIRSCEPTFAVAETKQGKPQQQQEPEPRTSSRVARNKTEATKRQNKKPTNQKRCERPDRVARFARSLDALASRIWGVLRPSWGRLAKTAATTAATTAKTAAATTPLTEALTWLLYEHDLRRQKEQYEMIQKMKMKN